MFGSRATIFGHVVFFSIFSGLILLFIKLKVPFNDYLLEIVVTYVLCMLMLPLITLDKTASDYLRFAELFVIIPILFYDFSSVLNAWYTNPNREPNAFLRVAIADVFHSVKDYGLTGIQSLYLLLCIPFSILIIEKVYEYINKQKCFLLGERTSSQPNREKDQYTILKKPSNADSTQPINHFWHKFQKGFVKTVHDPKGTIRYLEISYLFSFLSIFLLHAFNVPPLFVLLIPEPGFAYWAFMDTIVFAFIWSLYQLRQGGKDHIEKTYLKFILSFLFIIDIAGARTVFETWKYSLLVLVPPRTLFGMTIYMTSLNSSIKLLINTNIARKLAIFATGSFLLATNIFLTYPPIGNYPLFVAYLWGSSAVGIAIFSYVVSYLSKVEHSRIFASIIFIFSELAFMIKFFQAFNLYQFPSHSLLLWSFGCVVGFLGGLLWSTNKILSSVMMGLAWILIELFSGNWFTLFVFVFSVLASQSITSKVKSMRNKFRNI